MFTWGFVSGLMAFVNAAWQFYLLRFLLGIAEASLYPVIYASCIPRWFAPQDRARALALLLTSLQISSMIGAPLAGMILDLKIFGLHGWQTLFLIESIPALLFAFVIVVWMADDAEQAKWLTAEEKAYVANIRRVERERKRVYLSTRSFKQCRIAKFYGFAAPIFSGSLVFGDSISGCPAR